MKYKKKLKNLATRQAVWDRKSQREKSATTRPGSIKK